MRAIKAERTEIKRLYPDSPHYSLELYPRTYRAVLAVEMRRDAKQRNVRRDTASSGTETVAVRGR